MPPSFASTVSLLNGSADRLLKSKAENRSPAPGGSGLSALFSKLQNWTTIPGDFLNELQRQPCAAASLERVRERLTKELCVLCSGVAYRYWLSLDGERSIAELFYPGDFVNYDMLIFGDSNFLLKAKGAKFAMLERETFATIRRSSALNAILLQTQVAKSYFLTDRLCASLRSRAEQRVLRVLLEMKAHEELTDRRADDVVSMHFTQREVGDMTGITPVYVSKIMSRLEQQGHIIRHGRHMRFRDRARSARSCGFTNYYASLLSTDPAFHAA